MCLAFTSAGTAVPMSNACVHMALISHRCIQGHSGTHPTRSFFFTGERDDAWELNAGRRTAELALQSLADLSFRRSVRPGLSEAAYAFPGPAPSRTCGGCAIHGARVCALRGQILPAAAGTRLPDRRVQARATETEAGRSGRAFRWPRHGADEA